MAKDVVQKAKKGVQSGFDSTVHFLKHLFGKDLTVLSEQDSKKVFEIVSSLQASLLEEINTLSSVNDEEAKILAAQVSEITGFRFTPIKNPRGGQIYVVQDPDGKSTGGIIRPRKGDQLELIGDDFISKKGVVSMIAKMGGVDNNQLSDRLTEIILVASRELQDVTRCEPKKHEHKVSLPRALTTTAIAAVLLSMLVTSMVRSPEALKTNGGKLLDSSIGSTILPDVSPGGVRHTYYHEQVNTPQSHVEPATQSVEQKSIEDYGQEMAGALRTIIGDIGITADLNKGSMLEAFQERELSGNGRSTQEERQKTEDERSSYSAKKENLDTLFDQLENDYKSGGISSQEYFLGVLKLSSVACSDLSSANRAYVASLGEEARWVEVHRDYYISKGFDPAQHDQQLEDVGEKSDESVSFAENYQEQARFYGELFEELNAMNSRGEHIDEAVVQRVIKELQERHDSGLDQKAIKASTQSNSGNDERE